MTAAARVPARPAASSLDVFFRPRSVAVIGASRDAASMSGTLLRNLVDSFRGPIYPVNPRAADVAGLRAFPAIGAVPGDVDLAFLVVPAVHVLEAARQCLAKGVRGLIVISAGFSETGEEGRQRERALRDLLRATDVRLIGPNCLGVLNADSAAPLNGTFSLPRPPAGDVAVLTQSGALGFVFPEYMREWGLGISQLVSIGNKLNVGENELLEHWGGDDATRVIQVYLESFQGPQRFLEIARRVTRTKPVVALKAGRTGAGERAAGSHTAAMAGPDTVADGLFRQAGVIRVEALEELFETTALLVLQPLPTGRRVAVLTNAGGPGVLCADALEARGLTLPEFSPELQARLHGFLPPEAGVRNPIDLIGSTDPEQFRCCLASLLTSKEIDSVVVIYVPRLAETTPAIEQAVRDCAAVIKHDKTILSVIMEADQRRTDWPSGAHGDVTGEASSRADGTVGRSERNSRTDWKSDLQPPAIPCFRYPESAARALYAAVDYRERRARPEGTAPEFGDIDVAAVQKIPGIIAARNGSSGGWLPAHEVFTLLERIGLPVPRWFAASSADAALAAAEEIGYPVVVKAVSPTVLHKSDVGGVVLDVRTAGELTGVYRQMRARIPDTSAVLIQPLVRGVLEVLIGVKHDPAFGHLIGFGLGGVQVEALHDIRFRLHPLTDRDAEEMIGESLARELLRPRRRRPAGDVEALRDALLRVSALVTAVPQVCELDLNPVCVLPAGEGVQVLDARICVEGETGSLADARS